MKIASVLAGVLTGAAVLTAAAPAGAATPQEILTLELRALVDPQQVTGGQAEDRVTWGGTWQRAGDLPGRPGNRHSTRLAVGNLTNGLGGDVELDVDLTDSDCPDGGSGCTTLQRVTGTIAVPPGTTFTPGGAAHVVVTLDDATPGLTVTRAPGVPATPLTADATFTPVRPIPDLALDNLDATIRARSTSGDSYEATRLLGARDGAGAGIAFGVTLTPADQVAVFWGRTLTKQGPGLPLVRTAQQRRPWLPAPRDGWSSGINARREGRLAGTPVTSTGRRLPGDAWRLAATLDAVTTPRASAQVDSRTCASGEAWADCTPAATQVVLTAAGAPQVATGPDGRYAATAVFGVAPGPAFPPPADPQAWGTIRLSWVLAPGRVGVPRDEIRYYRTGIPFVTRNEYLLVTRVLRYAAGDAEATAPVSATVLGTAPVGPWRAGDADEVAYGNTAQAGGPPQPECCRDFP